MERCDLIRRLTTLTTEPDDGRVAEDTFDLFRVLARPPRAAVFGCPSGSQLTLELSHGVDQLALDLAHAEWARSPELLTGGAPAYGQNDERSFLLLPCLHAGLVSGLLYAEIGVKSRRIPAPHLATFASILGRALQARAGLLPAEAEPDEPGAEVVPQPDAERENLVLLLERNEWNVSRVARLLGVTRMTVYNRLRRFKVTRERVPKSPRRRARA